MATMQKYNGKEYPPSVVMEKANDSKFSAAWDFQYDRDGIVVGYCKHCPRGPTNNGCSVANLSQTARQHVCNSGGASGKRRVNDQDNFGPLKSADRGEPLPEARQAQIRRRLCLFLVKTRTPFMAVNDVDFQAAWGLAGVDINMETFYRTTQLDAVHAQVKELSVKDCLGLRKEVQQDGGELRCLGFIMDNTAANMKAMRLLEEAAPTIIALGCQAHALNLLCKDLSKEAKLVHQGMHGDDEPTLGTPTAQEGRTWAHGPSVAQILEDVKMAGLVVGDCEAIRTELTNQQTRMQVRSVHFIRANNPTRFAGLLLMAKDMQSLMGAIIGMTSSPSWEELKKSSVNAVVFDKLTMAWWRSLNLVVDLMQPICDAIHRLKADTPYLSQVLPAWKALVTHAKKWAEKQVARHPLTQGVVAAFERRSELHYSPVHAAAFVLDPAHFQPPRDGAHPRPPFKELTVPQVEDTIDTVARLTKSQAEDVRKELRQLRLSTWPQEMVEEVGGILEETRTTVDNKTVTAHISVRRNFWNFIARGTFPLFSEAATRLLSMHVTTAAAERNWSAWGQTYAAGRSQLGIEKAEKMVFIKGNRPKVDGCDPSELVALGIAS